MQTFDVFVKSHDIITADVFNADDNRPVDLDHQYARVKAIHRYDVQFDPDDPEITHYHILEMGDGFHFWFSHPCDEIAPTLADAERELFGNIF